MFYTKTLQQQYLAERHTNELIILDMPEALPLICLLLIALYLETKMEKRAQAQKTQSYEYFNNQSLQTDHTTKLFKCTLFLLLQQLKSAILIVDIWNIPDKQILRRLRIF